MHFSMAQIYKVNTLCNIRNFNSKFHWVRYKKNNKKISLSDCVGQIIHFFMYKLILVKENSYKKLYNYHNVRL